MANSIFGLEFYLTNDDAFRAFGGALSAQLGAMLTRVVTSSDIDWLTVTRPANAAYAANFEVYRFDDAAQATHPLFFKFEYGQNSNSVYLRLTIAKACDAAGVLSGVILPATVIIQNGASMSGIQNCYISNGSGSSLSLAFYPTSISSLGGGLIIERAYASNGSIDGSALWVAFKNNSTVSNNWNQRMIDYSTGTLNSVSTTGMFPTPVALTSGASLANGTVTPYFPAACFTPAGKYWIPRAALGGALVDCAAGAVINSLLDGFNYIGVGNLGGKSDQRGTNYSGMLMRW